MAKKSDKFFKDLWIRALYCLKIPLFDPVFFSNVNLDIYPQLTLIVRNIAHLYKLYQTENTLKARNNQKPVFFEIWKKNIVFLPFFQRVWLCLTGVTLWTECPLHHQKNVMRHRIKYGFSGLKDMKNQFFILRKKLFTAA